MRYNFRNDVICWKISKYIKVVVCILRYLTVSEILTFQIFKKIGQVHKVLFLQ